MGFDSLMMDRPSSHSAIRSSGLNICGGSEFRDHGLTLDLRGYQHVVLLDWRELQPSSTEPWDRLCDALLGREFTAWMRRCLNFGCDRSWKHCTT